MIKLEEIKRKYKFEPEYTFSQLQENLPNKFRFQSPPPIQDSTLHKAIRTLTELAYPTQANDYDKRWLDFYLPVKRRGYLIVVPLGVIRYEGRFFLSFPKSDVEVGKGKGKNDFYLDLIKQTIEFSRIIQGDPEIVTKAIPYDIKKGRILGKYVMEKLFPVEEKEIILKLYRGHDKKGKRSHGCSLEEYLDTAALCYKAAFGGEANGLTPEQMYRKWADGRDCGMLEIKIRKSREDFSRWFAREAHCGGHPFEIKFSWRGHGIDLIPPSPHNPYFILMVTDYMYAIAFLEMVKSLVLNSVPFEAYKIESVLDYLCGESYFLVNAYAEHGIEYDYSYRKILKHIEWDEPNMLKWRK